MLSDFCQLSMGSRLRGNDGNIDITGSRTHKVRLPFSHQDPP
jgi:hypothetical protein